MSVAAAPTPNVRPANIVQGEQFVTDDPDVVVSTLLGSCVAACLRDPLIGVGGMNHFLLPGREDQDVSYGVHAMELLVNALLQRGARRERLEAKLFGGARLVKGLTDVGAKNSQFAEDFLRREGVRNIGGSLRGEHGRRIQFWPVSGRARQVLLGQETQALLASERVVAKPPAATGGLELF